MEQTRPLQLLMDDVIAELRTRGNAEGTIIIYQRVYTRFLQFAMEEQQLYYSAELKDAFLAKQAQKSPSLRPAYLSPYKIAMNKLEDMANGKGFRLKYLQEHSLETSCFDWVIPHFKERLEFRSLNEDSIRFRLVILAKFLAFLEQQGLQDLKDLTADQITSGFEASSNKPLFRTTIREFLKYAAAAEWIPTDLSSFVPQGRKTQAVPSGYSEEDLEKCLQSIDQSTQSGKRSYAAFLLCARLGLRNSETCALKFSDIDWTQKTLSIIRESADAPLVLPLSPEIEEAISAYLSVRPEHDSPYIFLRHNAPYLPLRTNTLHYEWKHLLEQNEIHIKGKNRGLQPLRDNLANTLLVDGVHDQAVQKALGTSTLNKVKFCAEIDVSKLRVCALDVPPPSGQFAEKLNMRYNHA